MENNIKLTDIQLKAWRTIQAFEPKSKEDLRRLENAKRRFYNDVKRTMSGLKGSSGINGEVREILKGHDSKSRIYDKRSQNKNDCYALINGKRVKCEYKTNGGRIGDYLLMNKAQRRATFVIYDLDWYSQKRTLKDGTPAPRKHIQKCKIMRISEFLEMLNECNAIRTIGHIELDDFEASIKDSNSKLHKALDNFRDYEPNVNYEF